MGEARKMRITEENGEKGRGGARRKTKSEGGAVRVNECVGWNQGKSGVSSDRARGTEVKRGERN